MRRAALLAGVVLSMAFTAGAQGTWPYTAALATTPPTIDGTINAGEWPAAALVMNAATMAERGTMNPQGAGTSGDTDFSGTYWIMWDATYLYVAARVNDDNIVYLADQGEALNVTDVVQLCMDHQLARQRFDQPGIYIHDVTPGQASDNNTAAYFQHWNSNDFPGSIVGGRTVAAQGYYEVEMRLVWAEHTPNPPSPAVGVEMAYLAVIKDHDPDAEDLWSNAPKPAEATNPIVDSTYWNVLTLGPEHSPAPIAEGSTQLDAETAITQAGFTVGTIVEQYSSTVPEGEIISQDPPAGAYIPDGSAINLVVSIGEAEGGTLPAAGGVALGVLAVACVAAGVYMARRKR